MITILHKKTTYEELELSAVEAHDIAREYIARRAGLHNKWIDTEGYICWNDPDNRHGSVSTIRGAKANPMQVKFYGILEML